MPRLTNAVPKYRKHRASGQAVVTLNGRDVYLGPWKSRASRIEYDRLIGEWTQNGRSLPKEPGTDLTVSELIAAYWQYVQAYYVKDGRPTDEQAGIRAAMRHLRATYGHRPVSEFGPLALKAVRQRMIDAGNSRGYVNQNVGRIKRAFRWAAAQEMVPVSTYQSLATVDGLRQGRCAARETNGVLPIDEQTIQATLQHLSQTVGDMVRLQRLCGCRPEEVCNIRPCDVDRSGEVWTYMPTTHKTQHRGRERVIFLGPKAQQLLRPYLLRAADAFCFSPAEAEKARREELHANRKTPLQYGNRPGTNRRRNPARKPNNHYSTESYRRAVHRACDKAGVERWGVNRLRHAAGTEVRSKFGLEAAQVTLGHARADVTQVYAERDAELARRVAKEVG
jgi:integrase